MKNIALLIFIITMANAFRFSDLKKKTNMFFFKKITEKLPEFHKSGDEILQNNEKWINEILESDMNETCKKHSIRGILDLTILADGVASNFLKIYRKMVDEIL